VKKVAFILDGFELQSPGQQLLDRILLGWNEHGTFRTGAEKVALWMMGEGGGPLLEKRKKDFGLEIVDSAEKALAGAEFIIIVPGTTKFPNVSWETVHGWFNAVPENSTCYVDAAFLVNSEPFDITRFQPQGNWRRFFTSRASSHFIPLPIPPAIPRKDPKDPAPLAPPKGIEKVLIVSHGNFPEAELDSLHALAAFDLITAAGAVSRLNRSHIQELFSGPEWRPLVAAAVSRSNTIQGDPEKDGRTQDIVGLQIIEKLAREPRAWQFDCSGVKFRLLVLNGALQDFNLAVSVRGQIHSAQLYRPPAPAQEHFSALATWIVGKNGSWDFQAVHCQFLIRRIMASGLGA